MEISTVRTLATVVQVVLLAIQIVTGIEWMCIPIVLLMLIVVCLQKYEE